MIKHRVKILKGTLFSWDNVDKFLRQTPLLLTVNQSHTKKETTLVKANK